ncbi:MAG: sigma-54 dependent transcriptional regulator [Myxococcota bacterium]
MKPRVLIVDDDDGVRFTLREFMEELDVEVEEARDAETAEPQVSEVDLLLLDLRMPGMGGMELLRRIGADAARVVVLTAHGSERHAVEAMKLGAADYLRKPFEPSDLRRVIGRILEPVRLGHRAESLEGELNLARSMVFRSDSMRELARQVQRAGSRNVTVLITGESGTGKERVAQAIVRASARVDRPYVRFNCGAIPDELVEAELFGHEAGAFTGAERARKGLFREAEGGTLLLDEIGELGMRTQVKLLRVLQEKMVRPVGSDAELPIDVRILAATHRDLEEEVRKGAFREDLLYRLKVVTLQVPALRERTEDIRPLVEHFVEVYARRFGIEAHASEGWLRRLEAERWPGNVRQLENTVESALALSDGGWIHDPSHTAQEDGVPRAGLKARVEAFERGIIRATLAETRGNRSEAARRLSISRATLHDKMIKHGLS